MGRRGLAGRRHRGGVATRAGTVRAADAPRDPARDQVLPPGEVIAAQGTPGTQLYLVLDGIVSVDHDANALGDFGPGAVLGERAVVDAGPRTATLRADTAVRIAAAPADCIDRAALERLATGHQRERSAVATGPDSPRNSPTDAADACCRRPASRMR